jgi:hypothetical protein
VLYIERSALTPSKGTLHHFAIAFYKVFPGNPVVSQSDEWKENVPLSFEEKRRNGSASRGIV